MVLSACTPSGSNSSSSSSSHSDTYTYLSSRTVNDPSVKAFEAVAAAYGKTKAGKGFKLSVQSISDRPSYLQKIKVLASSNQLPDLFDADPEPYFHQIVKTGIIADIGKLYKEDGVTKDFYPISIDYPTWSDGSLNLITLDANAEYFFYNKDLFAKAGVTPPTTFTELFSDLAKIKAAGITPIAIDGKDQWPYFRYLAMPPFRETGNTFLDNLVQGKAKMSSPTGMKAIQFLQNLAPYFQPGSTNTDYTTALNLFTSGQAALFYDGTWELPSFIGSNDELKPNIGYFKMPVETTDNKLPANDFFANSGIGTAILKKSLTPELKGFLKYFFAHYANTAFYDYHIIPSIKPTIKPSVSSLYKNVLNDISHVQTYAKVWDVQLDANSVTVLGRESGELVLGQTSPSNFASQVDSAIQQYNQGGN
jgi:raffinose/stachyose/melibiose transport system substrate-binding protein